MVVLRCAVAFGKELLSNLQSVDVNTDFVKISENVSTGIAVIVVAEKDNRIILDKGANATLTKAQIDEFLSQAEEATYISRNLKIP